MNNEVDNVNTHQNKTIQSRDFLVENFSSRLLSPIVIVLSFPYRGLLLRLDANCH